MKKQNKNMINAIFYSATALVLLIIGLFGESSFLAAAFIFSLVAAYWIHQASSL